MTDDVVPLRVRLNQETALVPWSSLQRFFARGETIAVAADLSLLDVAVAVAEDRAADMRAWMQRNRVGPVADADAARWHAADAQVWAVVVRPWVLVQEPGDLLDERFRR